MADRLITIAGVSPVLAKIYARLGARPETLDQFLNPKLRDLLPNPSSLRDMDAAAERILAAINAHENIAIFADYDVDGATSAALLISYFRHFDIEPTVYVPDRLTEGYGPNTPAMKELAANNSLIICVDCGTLAHDPIAAVRPNTDVIVLDHHMGGETLPDALVVNPNRQDSENTLGYLAAGGVVFLVLVALNRLRGEKKPDLMQMLDLVALATVADVAPLIGVNRALVRTGLDVMMRGNRPGLAALVEKHLPHERLEADHIGFTLGPRLNAGGRIGRSYAATQLLISQNATEAANLIAEMETHNVDRREIEAAITAEAIAQIEANPSTTNFVFSSGHNWHPGVLGIVAARVKSHFGKPAVILSLDADLAQGSARSVNGIDLGGAVARLADEKLIVKGGGHKMAAGLSIEHDQITAAMARLDVLMARQANALVPALTIDAVIAPAALNLHLLDSYATAGPFGASAPAPIFALADMRMASRVLLKDVHIKYTFKSEGQSMEVMAFGAAHGPLDIGATPPADARFHLAVSIKRNLWRGRESLSVMLEDIAPAS